MVKRAKSPEPVEDSKFYTVVHPFPLNANMEVPNDFKEFMFWLATVVGKDYALGVYHKPSVSLGPFILLNRLSITQGSGNGCGGNQQILRRVRQAARGALMEPVLAQVFSRRNGEEITHLL